VVALCLVGWSRAAAQSADPAQVGQWTKTRSWPSQAHAHLLPTGEVAFNGEFSAGDEFHLWNPATGKLRSLPRAGYNSFCGGHSFLGDGILLVAGGHAASHVGMVQASLFNPFTRKWTRLPDMNDRRWYPTSTTLANGDALVISGETTEAEVTNDLPQVFDARTRTWRSLTGAVKAIPYYPREFVAPNGKVFVGGTQPDSWYLDTSGNGAWTRVGTTRYGQARDYGPAVLYGPGKVLYAGGGLPPTATVEVIDLQDVKPRWRMVAPMSAPRRQNNATLLPDGKVLVTGGSRGAGFNVRDEPVHATEVWDPDTETWTQWASMAVYRGYHSTALLLPDGRVLTAGGQGEIDNTMELFSPPYLFRGARPTITSAPASVDLAEPFAVETPDAASIAKVSLVRLGSVTHSFDHNQRFVPLAFSAGAGDGALTVNAPETSALAPPGHYMLFLVDRAGVPSIARILQLSTRTYVKPPGSSEPPPPDPSASPPIASDPPELKPVEPPPSEPSAPGLPATSAPPDPALPPAAAGNTPSGGCSSAHGLLMAMVSCISLWLARRPGRRRVS